MMVGGGMFEEAIPRHKIGTLLPLGIVDNAAYEFYVWRRPESCR
jgi:hypothetical protein